MFSAPADLPGALKKNRSCAAVGIHRLGPMARTVLIFGISKSNAGSRHPFSDWYTRQCDGDASRIKIPTAGISDYGALFRVADMRAHLSLRARIGVRRAGVFGCIHNAAVVVS